MAFDRSRPHPPVTIRRMRSADAAEAGAIMRTAFGTYLGLPEPASLWPDKDVLGTRSRANPDGALVAEVAGVMAGSNIATRWGTFAYFGPLTVRPEFWNRGISQHLLSATIELFERWGVGDSGLFTFANSARHIHLYAKFGFTPRFLTALLAKPVVPTPMAIGVNFSALSEVEQSNLLSACRTLTDELYPGLDVSVEILAVQIQRLGDTVMIWEGDSLEAFAVCHCGAGSEAGAGICYVKFAAIRAGAKGATSMQRLLDACEGLAAQHALHRMEAGVNLARRSAYDSVVAYGYVPVTFGVAMHRHDRPAFNRPDVFILDDWR